MPATRGDVEHLLEQLGYRRDDGDHRRFRLYIEGRLIAATMTSHGTREIHDGLLATIAGQMRIRPAFLRDLLAGRKRPKDYCHFTPDTAHRVHGQRAPGLHGQRAPRVHGQRAPAVSVLPGR